MGIIMYLGAAVSTGNPGKIYEFFIAAVSTGNPGKNIKIFTQEFVL
jgi:hypothetical protein